LINCFYLSATAQDTLPSFSLLNKGNNRIIISWTNPYGENIHQLSIQRSFDSTKNFRSILTLPDPTVLQNGFADMKATNDHMFYRLYILLDSGRYVFSKAKRPILDTTRPKPPAPKEVPKQQFEPAPPPINNVTTTNPQPTNEPTKNAPVTTAPITTPPVTTAPERTEPKKEIVKPEPVKPKEIPERMFYVKRGDTLIGQIGEKSLKKFRDSLTTRTKDTLTFNTADTIVVKIFVAKEVYRPSKYVFTEKDGNVKILLPQVTAGKKYSLKFFDTETQPAFEIKQIKDSPLILDKANFVHGGWFKFELYEDGALKEKNKLFIPKDF